MQGKFLEPQDNKTARQAELGIEKIKKDNAYQKRSAVSEDQLAHHQTKDNKRVSLLGTKQPLNRNSNWRY